MSLQSNGPAAVREVVAQTRDYYDGPADQIYRHIWGENIHIGYFEHEDESLHDAMKRRGFIIYAGQGDIRAYAFRVSNMGTLTPLDMKAVVDAFAQSLEELGIRSPER